MMRDHKLVHIKASRFVILAGKGQIYAPTFTHKGRLYLHCAH